MRRNKNELHERFSLLGNLISAELLCKIIVLLSFTCPGMDCPEAYQLKKHYPKSFFVPLHTLPPAGPKTSSAERDETRMQGFLLCRCLKDVSRFESVVGVLQAESHPGLQ